MSRGYLYVVSGSRRYFEEAVSSIASLKKVHLNAHVTVFTDQDFGDADGLIDSVEVREMDTSQRMGDGKVRHIADTPYDRTIFLDSDTHVLEPMDPLFDLLDGYDLALVQAPGTPRGTRLEDGTPVVGHLPYNCGLIAFKKSDSTLRLFARWKELFYRQVPGEGFMEGYKQRREQPAFALSAYESDASIYTLNHCWNIRIRGPAHLIGSPKMIHCRLNRKELDLATKLLRRTTKPRVWSWEQFKAAKKLLNHVQ